MKNSGRLEIIMGPMFGGKTTEILRRVGIFYQLEKFNQTQPLALYINSLRDNRTLNDSLKFSSHNPLLEYSKIDNFCTSIKVENLDDMPYISRERDEFDTYKYAIIAIDEAQFFGDLVENVKEWVSAGKIVIVAGLNGDFNQEKFGNIIDLIPFADSVDFVYPWCKSCYTTLGVKIPASFSKRIAVSQEKILIGATEDYTPSCRRCLK